MDINTIYLILGIAALFSGMRTIITKQIYDGDYENDLYGRHGNLIGAVLSIAGVMMMCAGLGFVPSMD